MKVVEGKISSSPDVAFFEVEQVGKPINENEVDYFGAIQTALAACHDPRYALIFAISSDGMRNRIYFGVTGRAPGTQPALFADQLGQFLCSNWPGTRVRMVEDYKEIADKVHVPLSTFSHARALPASPPQKQKKTQAGADPQTLDKLMRGMRGKPYLYLVLAEPMPETQVVDTVDACNSLSGQIHGFMKTTLSLGKSQGTSELSPAPNPNPPPPQLPRVNPAATLKAKVKVFWAPPWKAAVARPKVQDGRYGRSGCPADRGWRTFPALRYDGHVWPAASLHQRIQLKKRILRKAKA